MQKHLEIVDSGLLYANTYPADWSIHAYYSRIIEIRPRELLCVYKRAQSLYGDDGRSWILRSIDNGTTWEDEGCLYDGSNDEKEYSYSATNLTLLSNSEIVVLGHRVFRQLRTSQCTTQRRVATSRSKLFCSDQTMMVERGRAQS